MAAPVARREARVGVEVGVEVPCVQVIERLQVLVTSMPKADGEIEEIKDFCKGDFGRTMRVEA